ncbi:unnamed protein product [Cuscuta campestris]|uniref:Uncharacterized protein n=1 Tax=Cuscuta campestris TaxID=132261 RepID=A0A484NJ45_9ASTE|nr:unnamed protein product [Cuscuta campestris]
MKLEEGSSKADGANPPYHIYATSIMLAKYLGDKCVEVEHLAYASIFGKHMEFESEQLKLLAKHYKEICSKGFERADNACPL